MASRLQCSWFPCAKSWGGGGTPTLLQCLGGGELPPSVPTGSRVPGKLVNCFLIQVQVISSQTCSIPWGVLSLTLARTSYFAILDRTLGGGGCPPQLVCPLNEIEPCNEDIRKDRDVLNLTISDFTTLGHILTFPGQVKQKMLFFGKIEFLATNF